MSDAYLVGVGATDFHSSGVSIRSMAESAIGEALRDAGLALDDIDAVYFSNALAGVVEGQECIRGEVVMRSLGMRNRPLVNVENACASGGTALHLAIAAVRSGSSRRVLAVGAERMRVPDKSRTFAALAGAMDVENPVVSSGEEHRGRSPFIDVYAQRAIVLMRDRGVTLESLARVASKAWHNGALNPRAQRRADASPEKILASRAIVSPLTVDMCALIADGAAASIVSAEPGPGAIRVRGSQIRTLSANSGDPSAAAAASEAAYLEAALGPNEIDVAEVHDATAPGEMLSWVGTGLCRAGDEERWAQEGVTEIGGTLPVNPSGGLMARGHPVGASGLAQVYELVTQLRGDADGRQVANARTALAHVGGGVLGDAETAVAAVHILSRD